MTITLLITLLLASTARAASMSTLHRREHRQAATIHRDRGTLRFFHRHGWLVRARKTHPIAMRAIRFARAELAWTVRELVETRSALRPPAPTSAGLSAQASWYGPGFYGNRTACGYTLTTGLIGVAHKTMACGTRLLVCYGGRCIPAAVVDRGPYVAGREFDLTGGLAVALGFGGVGTISWEVLR
jgi:rare lipoprotein A (peptidoglycan hydrolase)